MPERRTMLTYSFENIGTQSLFTHLYECIRNDVISGNLAPGTRLPSKRMFAKNLGISTITVENAYAQLIAEGYLYSIPKKGYYVQDISSFAAGQGQEEALAPVPKAAPEPEAPKYFADFVTNQVRPENFPFSTWSHLMREALVSRREQLLANPPFEGVPELRAAIASHLHAFHGISVSPEQVVIGAGTEYLYGLLIQLLGRERKYAMEDPGYRKIAQVYDSFGVRFAPVSMDANGIRTEELRDKGIDVVHITPSHHFPTGITMPVSRRYELLEWARQSRDRYIIEDDYDSEFRLRGKPIPTLLSMDRKGKVIYMNTFTKTLASTIRIAYMVLPEHLLAAFREHLSFYSCSVSSFEQYTLAAFIESGGFERHINRMRSDYRKKRDALLSLIRESGLSRYATVSEQDAGLHFLLKFNTKLSDQTLADRAAARGIRLSPLRNYYYDSSRVPEGLEHTFVINYTSVDEAAAAKALPILAQIIRE